MENSKRKGIQFILCSAFGFAVMGLCTRLSGDLPTFEKVLFRNAFAVILSSILLWRNKTSLYIEQKNIPSLLIRSIGGIVGVYCNFYAIDHMHIADAGMLNKLSPFFTIVFSYFILKEKTKAADWLAVCIAFCGAVLIIKPGFGSGTGYALIGVCGGLLAGLAYTMVRKLSGGGVDSNLIVFYFSAISCIITLPLFLLQYQPMSFVQFLFLFGASIGGMVGQFCITRAYKYAPAKEIGVFDYTQIIFSALLGFVFLGQIPDLFSYMGYAIVIGVAVWRWKKGLVEERRL